MGPFLVALGALASVGIAGCARPEGEPAAPLQTPLPPPAALAPELPSGIAAAHPEAPLLRLCSWNLKKLGHGDEKNYAAVASVFESQCDVAALLEVMQKGGQAPGYQALVATLGSGWSSAITDSPRPRTGAGSAEFYAVAWRRERVQQCDAWAGLRFAQDNDGSSEGRGPDRFAREPAYTCLRAGEFDFVLALFHATWSKGKRDAIEQEIAALPAVFGEMARAAPGEGDLLVVGDFNLAAPGTLIATGGSTLNRFGELTESHYDHVLVADRAASREVHPGQVLDVRHVAASPAEFYRTVSDHLPVRVEIDVSGPDDDGASPSR